MAHVRPAKHGFIDEVFRLGPAIRHESSVTCAEYADRIVRGGLPEAFLLSRSSDLIHAAAAGSSIHTSRTSSIARSGNWSRSTSPSTDHAHSSAGSTIWLAGRVRQSRIGTADFAAHHRAVSASA